MQRQKRRQVGPLIAAAVAAVSSGKAYSVYRKDEGLQRSLYFWRHAVPIFLHYRYIQYKTQGWKDPAAIDAAYEELHQKYADDVFDNVILPLKGFYIKLAQVGSTRADFLPPAYLNRATELQDNAPSVPSSVIRQKIEAEFQKPLEELFTDFDDTALGVASIGQVHRARLASTGQEVVLKVQLPDAESNFRADIKTIKKFCDFAQPQHAPFLNEVEKQFMTEFDYRREAQNLSKVAANLKASEFRNRVVVPDPIPSLCTKNVLTMEYLAGKKLLDGITQHFESIAAYRHTTVEALKEAQRIEDQEREAAGLARKSAGMSYWKSTAMKLWLNTRRVIYNTGVDGLNIFCKTPVSKIPKETFLNIPQLLSDLVQVHGHEVLVDGCFNGDPHPGNFLLLPDGRIGLIDYGQVKIITRAERLNLARLVVALANNNEEEIVSILTQDMGVRTKFMNPTVLASLARVFMDRDDHSVTGGLNVHLFMESLEKQDPLVKIPDNYVMAFRVSLLLRGLAYALRYDVSHATEWKNIAEKVIREEG